MSRSDAFVGVLSPREAIGSGLALCLSVQPLLLLRILSQEAGWTKSMVAGSLAAMNVAVGMLGGVAGPIALGYMTSGIGFESATFVFACVILAVFYSLFWRLFPAIPCEWFPGAAAQCAVHRRDMPRWHDQPEADGAVEPGDVQLYASHHGGQGWDTAET